MKPMLLSFFLILNAVLSIPLPSQALEKPDIISIEKTPQIVQKVGEMKLDLLMEREGRIFIVAASPDRQRLDRERIPYRVETESFPSSFPGHLRFLGDGINGAFHSYQELEKELNALVQSYPQLAKLYTIGESLEQRNVYAIKISANASADEAEAEVLFTGCHHAREWISVEVPLLMAKHLAENYARDAQVKNLVDHCAVWFVPLVNPDGLEYSINVYRYWRKNRRFNLDGSFGVDLNRNYGYMWGIDNQGSSPYPDYQDYRGSTQFSEPETRALQSFFARRRFQALITYHSYAQVILFPWGYSGQPTPDDAKLTAMAAEIAARMKVVNGRAYEYGRKAGNIQYLTNGDTCDWAYGTYGIPAFTIELPPVEALLGGFINACEDISGIFAENIPTMTYLIQYAIDSYSPPASGPASPRRPSPIFPNPRKNFP